jgi:hypothetical protein
VEAKGLLWFHKWFYGGTALLQLIVSLGPPGVLGKLAEGNTRLASGIMAI